MFSNFPQIKGPLKRLARTIQARIRHYWNFYVWAEDNSRSWFERNILPLWTTSVSIFYFISRLCQSPPDANSVNETTSLLGGSTSTTTITTNSSTTDAASVRSMPPNIRGGVPVKPLELRVNPILDSPHHVLPEGTFYFSVDPYCVICRKTFHKIDSPPDDGMKWDHQFIAICPVVIKSSIRYIAVELEKTKEVETILKPIGFEKSTPLLINMHVITPATSRTGKKRPVRVPNMSLRQDAHAVHRTCRSLAASVFPDDHIHKLITQFGRSTKYLARTWCCENTWIGTFQHMSTYFSSLDPTDEVARFLYRLSIWPAELEDAIRNYSEHSLLSSIINFHRTTVPLIRSMRKIENQTQYLWFEGFQQIAAETIQIYDSDYISSLAFRPELSLVESSALKVSPKGVSGIQVGLGDYGSGVKALKILYSDGTSACVGTAAKSSFVTMIGANITGLKVVRDNLKVTAIELIAEKSWHLAKRASSTCDSPPIHPMFRSYMFSSRGASNNPPFPGWRIQSQKPLTKHNFYNWQVGSYHPLFEDVIPSITVYCLNNSVCGIAFEIQNDVAGGSLELLGSRNPLACAIHLEITSHEVLSHILMNSDAMRMEGDWGKNRCPSLLFTTNRTRALVCSPINKHRVLSQPAKYVQLHDLDDEFLYGIFTDGTTNPDGSIRNLGATFAQRGIVEPSEPILLVAPPDVLHIPASSLPDGWTTAFISTATFNNPREIATCKRGDRVTGLRIRHGNEKPTEVLGQFDPSNRTSIETVYRIETNKPLTAVIFRYGSRTKVGWGDADCRFVCAVEILSLSTSPDPHPPLPLFPADTTFVIRGEELLKPVAWLFNPTNDHLQFWDGRTREIEIETRGPKRELMLNPGVDLPERAYDPDFVLWDEHEGEDSDEDED